MPSPPKDRPSGRLGRLLAALRPSRAGPLPVQTGFPTSLADLVVKNHGRLKKQPSPSSKRGKRGAAASTSPSLSPSTPTSPASPSPPPASPPPPAAAVGVSSSDQPRPDLPPAQDPRRGGKGGGFGLGLGFLAVSGVVSLALLVIWSKKVVAAVTVASFSLYLLESVRSLFSLRPRRRPRPRPAVTERRLCLEDGRGRVSPIREVDADTEPSRPSCSDSDRGTDACILAVEVEEESSGGVLDESSNPKAKAKAKKKSWKKLLAASAKKLHRGRMSKDAGSSGSSFRSEGDRADDDATARGGNAKAVDSSGSRRGPASQTGVAAEDADAAAKEADSSRGSRRSQGTAPVEIDASVDDLDEEEELEEEEQAGIRFPALVLVAIVLIGLVAGKLLALTLTVLCAAFLGSVHRSPCGGGGGSQERRLELSM